jgi:LacI family transcriptional regulator
MVLLMPPLTKSPAEHPTLRTLAALAGVSRTTVSLALRNHPSISPATADRVRTLAAEQGYRPDPAIAKLMQHMRMKRVNRCQSTLCALQLRASTPCMRDYPMAVLNGARSRAESLGFGLDVMAIDEAGVAPSRLQRILVNRGIEGLLLLPMRAPVRLGDLLDWSRFSAVSATSSVIAPRLNAAMPDQFGNMLLLCRRLAENGCKRIGFVTVTDQDARVDHRLLSAYSWHSHFGGGDALSPFIMPRYDPDLDAATLHEWIRQQRPDAIISETNFFLDQIASALPIRLRNRILWASPSMLAPNERFIGIIEHAPEVGAAAVEMLAAMVQRGERGLPSVPRTTLIGGEFFVPRNARLKRSVSWRGPVLYR